MGNENKYKLDHKITKSKSLIHIDSIHTYDLNLESNHIYLFGVDRGYEAITGLEGAETGVDFLMANRFIKNLNLCMRVNDGVPILIHQKTCGGDWNEGMAIYDSIKSCPSPVTILNYTHARSMSSLIFQTANKRVMMPNSYFLFHEGTISLSGTYKGVNSNVAYNKMATKVMIDIYTDIMSKNGCMKGKNKIVIKKWIQSQMDKKEDVFLSAQEAIHYGFADEIFNNDWSKLTQYTDEQLQR